MLKLFSASTVFAFSRWDCGIWRWMGWPACSSISFSSSTESELYKDRASSISLLLLFNGRAAYCRIHLRPVMVGHGRAKVLRGVKAPQTRFWKLTPARTCNPFWKFLRWALLLLLLYNQLDVRKNYAYTIYFLICKETSEYHKIISNQSVWLFLSLPVWHFLFVVVFSVVSSVESSLNLLFSAALFERNLVVFHIRSN